MKYARNVPRKPVTDGKIGAEAPLNSIEGPTEETSRQLETPVPLSQEARVTLAASARDGAAEQAHLAREVIGDLPDEPANAESVLEGADPEEGVEAQIADYLSQSDEDGEVDKEPDWRKDTKLGRIYEKFEDAAISVVAAVIIRRRKKRERFNNRAVDKRERMMDEEIARIPPEVLKYDDEMQARNTELQYLYLQPPRFEQNADQNLWHKKWQERRTPADPVVVAEIAAAEAPMLEEMGAILGTGMFGIEMPKVPSQYTGTPYQWGLDDPRRDNIDLVQENNAKLAMLVDRKLVARQAVLAAHGL